jgi:hypothetical protein
MTSIDPELRPRRPGARATRTRHRLTGCGGDSVVTTADAWRLPRPRCATGGSVTPLVWPLAVITREPRRTAEVPILRSEDALPHYPVRSLFALGAVGPALADWRGCPP